MISKIEMSDKKGADAPNIGGFHWSRPGNDLDVDVDVYEDDFKEGDRDDKIKKDADAPNNVDS